MDEEDSQDELINKNASHGKGKRPAASIISDEEDNSEDSENSQEGTTDSEEDDHDSLGGEDEDGEDEDNASEHADGEKDLQETVGGAPTDLAGLSSDEDAEKCPICLNSFHEQPVATPESCEHYFCLDCILEWAKNANSCPVDRLVFTNILLRKCYGGKVQKTITVQKPVKKPGQEEQVDLDLEQTICEVCGGSDREDRLLLCDGCDAGYHMECLTPPLNAVPVEEWFCPECAANNRGARGERLSEEESSVLPTTSRSRPGGPRATRAIARTQHSERVRANVNRHRITQLAPHYLMQSTWLDETINAVVAGLNTAVYIRDLTPRPRSRRRRRTVKRKKTSKDGKAAEGKSSSTGVKRRKRKVRRTRSRKKMVVKKEISARSRIARSLGIRKSARSSSIPSVYRPSEQTLGSMRADIGAASLSIYGDPFDLDPFEDRDEEMEQAPSLPSLLEAKRRGLSRSALRSHQPVARPIPAGLTGGRGHAIPQVEEMAEAAPVPDLLGSILSGQSLLLMDSSDVVINRDGSLKATKPVCLSSPRSSLPSLGETGHSPSNGTDVFQFSREPASSSGPSSSHTSPHPCHASLMPTSPCPPSSHTPLSVLGHPRLQMPHPHRLTHSNPAGIGLCQRDISGARGQPPTKVSSSDSQHGEGGGTTQQAPAKKPPPKPVWVDVSVLPRIPKIKRENGHSSRSHSSNLPESSLSNLAGDKGRQQSVDQQGASTSQQSRTVDSSRQRPDRSGPSASFSNSFSTPSTSASFSSSPWPSSSSSISFRINTSGNSWHSRRLSAPEPAMPAKGEDSLKKNQKDKQMLLSSQSQAKKTSLKSEVYDPFNPTGSDSSDSESENDCHEANVQSAMLMLPTVGQNESSQHQIKTEPMDLDSPEQEESFGTSVKVKEEPFFLKDDPWSLPSQQLSTGQMQSSSLAAVTAYSRSPAISDAERSGTPEIVSPKTGDHSRSSSTSSHRSDNIKVELKTEPEDEPSPVKSLAESQVPKDNGLYDEVLSVASSSDVCTKSKEKEKKSPQFKSDRGRQSPVPSRDSEGSHKKKKHLQSEDRKCTSSRSPGRRRSRSRSNERRHSRSRSKERRHSQSRDRRRSTRSSSREFSRKRKEEHESGERCDSRGKDCQKFKERKRSRSRSRSRSRERRRERPSSCRSSSETRIADEMRSKRKRSRSTSRDRRHKGDMLQGSLPKERSTQKTVESTSMESKEPSDSSNDILSLEKEMETVGSNCETTLSVVSIEKETKPSSPWYSYINEEYMKHEEITEEIPLISLSNKPHETKPKEIKQENVFSLSQVKESQILKDIKTEKDQCSKLCDKLKNPEEIKNEKLPSPIMKKIQEFTEATFLNTTQENEDSYSAQQGEKKSANDILETAKQFKVENFWPDEDDEDPCYSDGPLVINLNPSDPDPLACEDEADGELMSLPEVAKKEVEMEALQQPCPVKQEPVDSSDDDINVDYLIDNLDFIKEEMKEGSVTNPADTEEPHPAMQEEMSEAKQEMESALVMAGTKAKSQAKRVTWNIQEPEGPQPEKMSKLALFKLKLKQEGSRKAVSSSATQSSVQEAAAAPVGPKPPATSLNPPAQGGSKSHREELLQDPHHKDKYMKKLHMQERAIEEVKLAIKPFYQKRDITKEEYKDILRKAVQKVCHSKSGEINPVKVANLVKAYVDKYKHARKHRKGEDSGQRLSAEVPKHSETSG